MSELKPCPFTTERNWKRRQRDEALLCFRIVQGPGDAGSEAEFNCRNVTEQAGWLRLANYCLAKRRAAHVPQYAAELRDAEALVAQLTAERTRLRALLVRCHDAITLEAIATEKFTEPPERCSAWWELRRTIAAELERSK